MNEQFMELEMQCERLKKLVNANLNAQELAVVRELLSERLVENKNKSTADLGKYIEMKALKGKVEGLIDIRCWEGEN